MNVPSHAIAGAYLQELKRVRRQAEATPELSLRDPLMRLLGAIAGLAGRSTLLIAQEATVEGAGQPDVFIKDGPRLVGYVETKAPGSDLNRLLRESAQLRRYRRSLPSWVLTDYYTFWFLRDGEIVERVRLADPEGPNDESMATEPLLSAFIGLFSYAPPVIRSPARLARELARRARILRDGLQVVLEREPEDGPLRGVLRFYQQSLMSDLDEAGFADTFAQTITYGMFLGRLHTQNGSFTRQQAASTIPQSVPFLRSAVRLLVDSELVAPPIVRLLDDLAALLENTDVARIRTEVAAGGLEHDLVIYFYERFLEQYDEGERMNRGVYYTAPELVSYLVRATDEILRRDFGLPRGFADHSVQVLDPAVGTGTFLLGTAELALATEASRGTASQRRLIHEHLLPDLYGLELLPAPYAIAHLKMTSFYEQFGYELSDGERVNVCLTNTLEPREPGEEDQLALIPMVRGIVEEGHAAGRVKNGVPVLAILGNPPYDRTSHNANDHSDHLLEEFYSLDGVRIRDRNTGPLRDDYLRFLRWSVWKLLEQPGSPGHGILAFVTNRAFVERTLHRGVRRFLLRMFDEIYIYDLHGDQREWFRDRVDEKVFSDVQAGIALTVFVKRPEEAADGEPPDEPPNGEPPEGASAVDAVVRYREAFGTRHAKLAACAEASLADPNWRTLEPHSPLWLCVPYDVAPAYDTWPTVAELFPQHVIGVQTHRDQLVVAFTEAELRERLRRFADADIPDQIWEADGVRTNRDWNLPRGRESLRSDPPRNVIRWAYRGFDRRWISFDERLIDYTRTQISPHLIARGDNVALIFANGSLTDGPYAFVSRRPVPAAALSWRTFGQGYMAPLWIHEPLADTWRANVPDNLIARMDALGIRTDAPGLLAYVYAVLNAPAYRRTYADGLRYGFARVPITRDSAVFEALRELGATLIQLHLLEDSRLETAAPMMNGDDQSEIAAPRTADGIVHLSETLTASPVSAEAWSYQQGGYRVLNDYLADREGRRLSGAEFDDFRLTAAAIALTLEVLPRVDDLLASAETSAFTAAELGLATSVP